LEEGVLSPHLGGAYELSALDEDFAADRLSEAGGRTVGWSDGRTVRSEAGSDTQ